MKITYAKFENYIGFYDGIGQKEVEINFSADDPEIIMLIGRNGSGKTTLLSSLQPFAGNNDNRKNIIIPGCEGKKTLVIRNNEQYYKSVIIYPEDGSTAKCLFHLINNETGEELTDLNPGGKKRNYEESILTHLGIKQDFFAVGRVGSNVSNFIDYTSSDRKKYIGKHMPSIDPYLDSNSIVGTKVSSLKKIIIYITEELGKIPPKEEIDERLSKSKLLLSNLSEMIEQSVSKIGNIRGQIQSIVDSGKVPENAIDGTNIYQSQLEAIESKIATLYTKLEMSGIYSSVYEYMNDDVSEKAITAFIETMKSELNEQRVLEATEKANLSAINEKIDSLKSRKNTDSKEIDKLLKIDEDISLMRKQLASQENSLMIDKEALSGFDAYTTNNFKEFNLSQISINKERLTDIYEIVQNFRMRFRESGLDEAVITDKKTFTDARYGVSLANRNLEKLVNEKNRIEGSIGVLRNNVEKSEILKKRPSNCSIDTCPFIVDALQFINAESDLAEAEVRLSKITAEIATHTSVLSNADILDSLSTLYSDIFKKYNTSLILRAIPVCRLLFNEEKFYTTICLPDIEFQKMFDISYIENYISLKENIVSVEEKISQTRQHLLSLNSSENILNTLKDKILSYEDEIATLVNGKLNMVEIITEINTSIEKYNSNIALFNNFVIDKADETKLTNDLKTLEVLATELESNLGVLRKHNADMASEVNLCTELKIRVKPIQDEIDICNINLEKREDFTTRLEKVQNNFNVLEIVKKATDPVKGIPLYLIQDYLESIRIIANDLLDSAYNGTFKIDPFVLTESEFLIPIRKGNGQVVSDVCLVSQGESSLVKTTLSFAIFIKAMGIYDILSLDEVDSTLDKHHRRNFLDIIKNQISELGLEQLFIISHNEEFLSSEVGLILMKDHGLDLTDELLMQNKKIIANYGN